MMYKDDFESQFDILCDKVASFRNADCMKGVKRMSWSNIRDHLILSRAQLLTIINSKKYFDILAENKMKYVDNDELAVYPANIIRAFGISCKKAKLLRDCHYWKEVEEFSYS